KPGQLPARLQPGDVLRRPLPRRQGLGLQQVETKKEHKGGKPGHTGRGSGFRMGGAKNGHVYARWNYAEQSRHVTRSKVEQYAKKYDESQGIWRRDKQGEEGKQCGGCMPAPAEYDKQDYFLPNSDLI